MLPFYSFGFWLAAACAVFFYRAARFENNSGLVWGGLSVLVSIAILRWLHGGFFMILLGQAALFGGITLWRGRQMP